MHLAYTLYIVYMPFTDKKRKGNKIKILVNNGTLVTRIKLYKALKSRFRINCFRFLRRISIRISGDRCRRLFNTENLLTRACQLALLSDSGFDFRWIVNKALNF
jgi:hypothetical protein